MILNYTLNYSNWKFAKVKLNLLPVTFMVLDIKERQIIFNFEDKQAYYSDDPVPNYHLLLTKKDIVFWIKTISASI